MSSNRNKVNAMDSANSPDAPVSTNVSAPVYRGKSSASTSAPVPPPLPPPGAVPGTLMVDVAADMAQQHRQESKAFGISLAIVCGGILLIALFVDLANPGLPTICTFYRVTGLPCSGCGLSRGCCAIAHGRWEEAWQYNPFSFVFMPLFVVGFIGGCLTAWRPALRSRVLPRGPFMVRLAIGLAITMTIFGVWRVYEMVGWAGIQKRLLKVGSGPPPVVLLHGDLTIPRPAPGR